MRYLFDAELWRWEARTDQLWTFFAVPQDASDEIRDIVGDLTGGFGAVKVRVTVGTSTWETSIFPQSGTGPYSLPIKAAVRKKEGIDLGDTATVDLELVGF